MYFDSEGFGGVEEMKNDPFKKRKKKGDKGFSRILEVLEKERDMGFIEFNCSSYEKNVSDSYLKKIVQNYDIPSRLKRHYPDLEVITRASGLWLIDTKNSKSIEKDSYDTCQGEVSIGKNVAFVFYQEDEDYLQFITFSDLKLKKIRPKFNGKYLPADNAGWIYPCKFSEEWTVKDKNEWKDEYGGSATDYGYIDFKSYSIPFQQFLVIVRSQEYTTPKQGKLF